MRLPVQGCTNHLCILMQVNLALHGRTVLYAQCERGLSANISILNDCGDPATKCDFAYLQGVQNY